METFLPEINVLSIRDSTLYTATPIGRRSEVAIFATYKEVIVLTTRNFCSAKTRANLESLCGWDGQHCVAKLGFELVKNRLAKPGGNVANDASDRSTDRILGLLGTDNALESRLQTECLRNRMAYLCHTFRCLEMGTTGWKFVYLLPC